MCVCVCVCVCLCVLGVLGWFTVWGGGGGGEGLSVKGFGQRPEVSTVATYLLICLHIYI